MSESDLRKEFEKWIRERFSDPAMLERYGSGEFKGQYTRLHVQCAWDSWTPAALHYYALGVAAERERAAGWRETAAKICERVSREQGRSMYEKVGCDLCANAIRKEK